MKPKPTPPGEPPYLIADKEPVFPCELFYPGDKNVGPFWSPTFHKETWREGMPGFTHWRPMRPSSPASEWAQQTKGGELSPKDEAFTHLAKVRADCPQEQGGEQVPEWAKRAAEDYLGNPGGEDEEAMYHQCDIDDLAECIAKHARQSTPARSQAQERGELRAALEEMAEAGRWATDYVGAANYRERQAEAMQHIKDTLDRLRAALVSTPAAGGELTPNASLAPLVDGPRRTMLVEIRVSEDFEKRLDNQWEVEREIKADRWKWKWETDYVEPYKERIDFLEHQNTQQAVETEQLQADLQTTMNQLEAQARPSGEPGDTQWKAGYMARLNEETVERPEPKHPTLWRYLDNAHKKQIARHIMVANRQPDGGYHFYIHPEGVSGDTQDYLLWPDPFTWEDMLVNRLDSPPPDAEGFKRALRLAMQSAHPTAKKEGR